MSSGRGRKRGLDRERNLRDALVEAGWVATRASMGPVDVIAMRHAGTMTVPVSEVRLVQVKSTAQSPYERFGPAERQELLGLAKQAGASAWLVWWPPRKAPVWIRSSEWPR